MAETNDFAQPHFHFKMADIMKKTQDKMALIILIVDGFGSLHKQIDSGFFPGKSAGVIFFSIFRCIVKKLSAKKHCRICSH